MIISNMLTVLSIVSGILILTLGLVVLKGTAPWNHRWPFAVLSMSSGLWAICIGLFYSIDSEMLANLLVPIYYIFALYIGYGLLYFCLSYSTFAPTSFLINFILFLPVVVFSSIIAYPDLFIKSIILSPDRNVILDSQLYIAFSIVFSSYAIVSLLLLTSKYIVKTLKYRKVLALIFATALTGGAFFNLVLPYFGIYSGHTVGPLFTLLIVGSFSYLVINKGLFNVKQTIAKSVAYLMSILSIAMVYSFFWYSFYTLVLHNESDVRQDDFLINILAITVLTSIFFQPVKNFFDKITSHYFLKYNYTIESFLAEISSALTSSGDLRTLFSRASLVIAKNLKSTQVFFTVWYGDERLRFVSAGTPSHRLVPHQDIKLLENYSRDADFVITSELAIESEVRRMLISHNIALVLNLKLNNQIFGFLFLGERQLANYSKRDLDVLLTLKDEFVIAIQNTISTQKVKELNEQLHQKIDSATYELRLSNKQLKKLDTAKDEFLSLASHQLRTPLTSVKGYLSMVLEGDVGRVTSKQHRLLSEAFISSERMVHLINDFLSVSRLQTGKFVMETHIVDIEKIIRQEINTLKPIASGKELKLRFRAPKESLPMLLLDEAKIRQVIINYIDNAIYYSNENSTIEITLSNNRNQVIFKVKDYGIGVPRVEKSQLFNKFYRASNARKRRPDGTGVGLYLARKVIDAHHGKILFESTEGKGSVFGFSLPIDLLMAKKKP